MQDKLEMFKALPEELLTRITQDLSNRDLAGLIQTSKNNSAFFKPLADVRKLQQLLHHVAYDEHYAVQSILTTDISFIFKRGFVKAKEALLRIVPSENLRTSVALNMRCGPWINTCGKQ